MEAGVVVACRLLPALASEVEQLATINESFRDLCEDLAAAEHVLSKLVRMSDAAADQRLAECEDWIVSLTAEIKDAVRRAKSQPRIKAPSGRFGSGR
jgi:hypothetical protein